MIFFKPAVSIQMRKLWMGLQTQGIQGYGRVLKEGCAYFRLRVEQIINMYNHLNCVSDHPHIPQEAFLFVPHRSDNPKVRDDFKVGEGKNIRRLLFEGWAQETLTPYEKQKMKQFEEYLHKNSVRLDPRWDAAWKLRFLLSSNCNFKKCVTDMQSFISFQNSVRELSLTKVVSKYLKEGVFYISGRDSHYRPILIFDVDKIIKFDMSEEDILETQTYFFEYVIRNYLIPGQVESWVAVVDMSHNGLFSLISTMKRSFSFLSDTYRERMFVCYVIRIPNSISILWNIFKNFLEEETMRKINLFQDQTLDPLLEECSKSQLEVKYGGSCPNIQQGHFWPPRELSQEYQMKSAKETIKFMTKQEYADNYNKGVLHDTKIHAELIKAPVSIQLRENHNELILKRMEKTFKLNMEMLVEDTFDFDQEEAHSKPLSSPLSFVQMLKK